MRRALSLLDEGNPDGITLLEVGLLGCLMLAPYNRLQSCLQSLRPSDFSAPHRGIAFAAIMTERHPELPHVVARLEADGAPVPHGRAGWGDALARLLDLALVDDDAVPEAVRRIKEAAIARKLSTLGRRDG